MNRFIPTKRELVFIIVAFLLTITALVVVAYKWPDTIFVITGRPKPLPDLPFIELTDEERAFYKSQYVNVTSADSAGSGCKLDENGEEYLTALHVLVNGYINNATPFANNHATTIVEKSKYGPGEKDYAILSTNLKATSAKSKIPAYQFKEGENVVVVGSPGNQQAMVQPGRIINVQVKTEDGQPKPSSQDIYSVYVKEGLSGGCIYPYGWTKPVAVFAKGYKDTKQGEISLINRLIE